MGRIFKMGALVDDFQKALKNMRNCSSCPFKAPDSEYMDRCQRYFEEWTGSGVEPCTDEDTKRFRKFVMDHYKEREEGLS